MSEKSRNNRRSNRNFKKSSKIQQKNDTHSAHIHDRLLSSFVTGTSVKSGGFKQVLSAPKTLDVMK